MTKAVSSRDIFFSKSVIFIDIMMRTQAMFTNFYESMRTWGINVIQGMGMEWQLSSDTTHLYVVCSV